MSILLWLPISRRVEMQIQLIPLYISHCSSRSRAKTRRSSVRFCIFLLARQCTYVVTICHDGLRNGGLGPGCVCISQKRENPWTPSTFSASLNISGRPSLLGDWVLIRHSNGFTSTLYIRSTCFGTFSDNVSPCGLHQTSCKIACSSPSSSEFGAVRSVSVDELFNRKNLIRGYPNGRVKHSNTRRIHNFPAVGQLVFFHRCIYPYTQISVNPDFEVILV